MINADIGKEATVSRYHYASHEELKKHLHAFLMAYNLASRLKTLKGKSPYDFIKVVWTTEPERFIVNPNHFNVGLNSEIYLLIMEIGRTHTAVFAGGATREYGNNFWNF